MDVSVSYKLREIGEPTSWSVGDEGPKGRLRPRDISVWHSGCPGLLVRSADQVEPPWPGGCLCGSVDPLVNLAVLLSPGREYGNSWSWQCDWLAV